jgi:hypothetical protein
VWAYDAISTTAQNIGSIFGIKRDPQLHKTASRDSQVINGRIESRMKKWLAGIWQRDNVPWR